MEVEIRGFGIKGFDPHGGGPRGPQELPQVFAGHRIAPQTLLGGRRPGVAAPAAGDQIGDRDVAPIGQIGDGETELLQDRDARIVNVVIGPLAAGEPAEQRHGLGPQGRVVHRRVGRWVGGDDGGSGDRHPVHRERNGRIGEKVSTEHANAEGCLGAAIAGGKNFSTGPGCLGSGVGGAGEPINRLC